MDNHVISCTRLSDTWCCATCRSKFAFGQLLVVNADELHPWNLACPHCGAGTLHSMEVPAVPLRRLM